MTAVRTVEPVEVDVPALAARVRAYLDKLDALKRKTPDVDEAPNLREGERLGRIHRILAGRRRRLQTDLDLLVGKVAPRLADRQTQVDLLLDGKAAMAKQLREAEAQTNLPASEQRRQFDSVEGLRESLRVLDVGVEWVGPGTYNIPTPLSNWLRKQGEFRLPGVNGLEPLSSLQLRIADLEAERAKLVDEIEHELAQPVEPEV